MTELVRLASLVFNRVHWIEPVAAEVLLGVLDGRIGNLTIARADDERMSRFEGERVYSREGRWRGYSITPRGTAILPIVGELVNRGAYLGADSGLVSYEGVRQQLKNAASDPSVRAIVLDIDSPGGMVAGCAETASLVRDISRTKPVVAACNSDTCSAAYAIASGANVVMASESSRVGSIGVLYVHADRSVELSKKGIAVTIFQAGKHKTDGHPFGPLSGEVATDIQKNIDAHYDAFVKLVVSGRPQLSEQQVRDTEARVYRGSDAAEHGLADQVGTFEQAVALAEAGQVKPRPQERSSVPAPQTQPQKVAANTGVKTMEGTQAAAPVSGYEDMTVAQIAQAVQSLRASLGFDGGVKAAAEQPAAAPVEPPPAPAPAAQQKPAETVEQAAVRGRSEEKARIKAILSLPEAKDRPVAALALAIETEVPAASAGAVLAKMQPEAKPNGRVDFYAAVAASGGAPKVGHMAPEGTTPKSGLSAAADKLIAAQPKPQRLMMPART